MSWWSRILARLRGDTRDEAALSNPAAPAAGEPQVFECQACFKVFDLTRVPPACPECDSPDVRSLTG
jgi:Zn finger protein HypA/HybF involved in hydrogenase expression